MVWSLSYRKPSNVVDGVISNWLPVVSGVPHGLSSDPPICFVHQRPAQCCPTYILRLLYLLMMPSIILMLIQLLIIYIFRQTWMICSSNKRVLNVPRTLSSYGARAFCYSAPRLQNALPADLRFCDSLDIDLQKDFRI